MFNDMEFYLVNLLYPTQTVSPDDEIYWRECLVGCYRSKFIRKNVEKIEKSFLNDMESVRSKKYRIELTTLRIR
jgi:hypothetical protein